MNTYLAKGSNITFSFSLFTKENVYLMSSTPALSSSRDHVITRKNSNRYRKNIIHIPEGISYIATEAFQHQSCIRSVSFPDSLRKIGARAGLRQLRSHKTSYKIAGSRLNSGFFSVKSCQIL